MSASHFGAVILVLGLLVCGQVAAWDDDHHQNYWPSLEKQCWRTIHDAEQPVYLPFLYEERRLNHCRMENGLGRWEQPVLERLTLAPGTPKNCETLAELAKKNRQTYLDLITRELEVLKC